MADFDKDVDKKIEGKFLIIDKKLKDAFTGVKKDIAEVKSSLKDNKHKTPTTETKLDTKQIEDKIELLNKEIERLSALSIKSPKVDNEKLKLEKEILQLKIKEAREEQKNSSTGRISRLINRIGVWKEKHKLNKQYRKQLEQINKKHDEFEQELIEKTKQLDKLYSKSANRVESKFNESLDNIKKENQEENNRIARERLVLSKEYSRSLSRFEQERQRDKELFLAQNEQADNQRNQIIKELSKTINKSEKRFDKLLRDIESKRREDASLVNSQLNVISNRMESNSLRFEQRIEELKKEIDLLRGRKVKDEKRILDLENEKNYFQDKLKAVKSVKSSSRSFKLPKFSLPKLNFPNLGVKPNDFKVGFWLAVPYIFLAILAIVALNQYFKWDVVSLNTTYWIVAGVIFGALTFWHNRDKIESSMEDEKKSEELDENKRASEFEYKFPRLAKFDFDYRVASSWKEGNYLLSVFRALVSPFVFLARLPFSFVKWMYKEGFWYSIGLIAIVVLVAFLYFHQLGSFDLREDEFPVVDAAAGYFHTGTFFKWDWIQNKSGQFTECINADMYCNYNRAWPHTVLVALSYNLFGISEWSSRLISALFGIFMVVLSYLISKKITKSKNISLLFTLTVVLNYQFVQLFRYTRMYALFIPIFFLFVYLLGKGITNYSKNKELPQIISFRYFYLFLATILFLVCYLLHINTLIIGPAFLVFLLFNLFLNYKSKYLLLFAIGLASIVSIFVLIFFKIIDPSFLGLLGFLNNPNFTYWDFLFNGPFNMITGISLVLANSFIFFDKRFRLNKELIILIYSLVFSAGMFFVYFAMRYSGFTYISHIVPFAILLVIYSFYRLSNIFNQSIIKLLLIILLILSLLLSSLSSINSIYNDENSYGKYSVAYPTIVNNYKLGDVIFGQYLKGFYLNGIPADTKIIDMKSNKQYTYETFINDLSNSSSGWLTWETRKSAHIRPEIISYIDKNFKKYNGKGVDSAGIELYYFSKK